MSSDIEKEAESSGTVTAVASEEQPPTPTQGINRTWSMGSYPKLSKFMGSWPDVAIFRRFGNLNVENLLFLQAELSYMEDRLNTLRKEENHRQDPKGLLAQRSWLELSQPDESGNDSEHWELIQDIREKLKDYNEALLQYKSMCALQNPTKPDLRKLREWLLRPELGDNFLKGVERDILHSADRLDADLERASDLVTMSREAVEHDFFSRWLSDQVLDKFHSLIGRHFKRPFDETGMVHYRKLHLRAVSHLIGVVLASVIPAASIFTLYFVQNPINRLVVLLAYSALFSVCLALFTSARRVEIFAATAAFASVQVVFVGSTIRPGLTA